VIKGKTGLPIWEVGGVFFLTLPLLTMYQSSSPYAQPMSVPTYGGSGYTPPVNGSVHPGDISYGQIVGGDGKIVYQLFKYGSHSQYFTI
jgi:hypothetical protein